MNKHAFCRETFICGLILITSFSLVAQEKSSKARLGLGLSVPEMIHVGLGVDITTSNQIGVYGGIGPSWNTIWTSLNLEHRLYFGKLSEASNRKQWFIRQSYTYYPPGDDSVITFTLGKDLKSKTSKAGWTIDFGMFYRLEYVRESESEPGAIIPALRIQFYAFL